MECAISFYAVVFHFQEKYAPDTVEYQISCVCTSKMMGLQTKRGALFAFSRHSVHRLTLLQISKLKVLPANTM